jgi:formate hydrogenlyase subunit 3/multisubunit Na+/H+ antiporter MnhD subunit
VAYWMFPMPPQSRERGGELPLWLAFGALNAGLLLRAVAEPAHAWQPTSWSGALLTVSGALQAAATWLLVLALWPRVRGRAARLPGV